MYVTWCVPSSLFLFVCRHCHGDFPAAGAMYNNALFVHLDNVLYDPTWLPKALTTIYTKIG